MPQPQVTEDQLREMTNAEYGQGEQAQAPAPTEAMEVQPVAEETIAPETSAEPAGQVDISESLKDLLDETPYKGDDIVEGVKKLSEGYKNLQSEYTKTRERVKPHEQLLNEVVADRNLADFLEQARVLYKNPHLVSAYASSQGRIDTQPDPRQYNMYEDADLARYQKDLSEHNSRQVDSRLNARLGEMEQRNQIETWKFQFRQGRPDVDADELYSWAQAETQKINPFEQTYRIKNFEAMESQAMEKARKELNNQLKIAQTTKTPVAPSGAPQKFSAADIIAYQNKYGAAAAVKRFGEGQVNKAERELTDQFL